ncbi:hypothetical protein V8D89_000453 [Ganoderma adspersum]
MDATDIKNRTSIQDISASNVLSALYGIFTLLCCASIYFLVQGNDLRTRRVTLMISLTILALFTSTTVYTVVSLFWATRRLTYLLVMSDASEAMSLLNRCNCAKTATLTINILLGDAIVCWRACSVWQRNRFIMGTSTALLLATFALAIVDTRYTCMDYSLDSPLLKQKAAESGRLYKGASCGVAASVLSLCTNLYATAAVALKAWHFRRILRRYIVTGPMFSQAGKALSMLVESGMIYCGIWVLVVAYQAGMYARAPGNDQCLADISCGTKYYHSFWYIFGFINESSLVPLIAIYPTIIIILVALNRSHVENGFLKATQSGFHPAVPLRELTVAVDTAVTTRCDIESRGSSGTIRAICEEEFAPEDRIEGSSIHAEEEKK